MANKSVGANDAAIDIYEADSVDSIIISKSILSTEIEKKSSRDLLGLNLIVGVGKWVNMKTDDNTIYATIMFYYVPT